MHRAQGIDEQVKFGGIVQVDGKQTVLMGTVPLADVNLAKQILYKLFLVDQTGWDLEIRNQILTFWSARHKSFAYRMKLHECGKGLSNVTRMAKGLIERIEAGHYDN